MRIEGQKREKETGEFMPKQNSKGLEIPCKSREIEKEEKPSFKLIVDNGKPYEQDFNTLQELKAEIKKLKNIIETEPDEFPYFDFSIWRGEEELTEQVLSEI